MSSSAGAQGLAGATWADGGLADLLALFESLTPPVARDQASGNAFTVVNVPGTAGHRLGRDMSGAPCVLLDVRPHRPGEPSPLGVTLAHLSIRHDVPCELLGPGRSEVRRMTIIRFVGVDRELRAQFLRVVAPVLRLLGDDPTPSDVTRAVRTLVDLFRALEKPARRSVQGLWAELLLIARAPNAPQAVSAWHAAPGERYDFVVGPERVEVKSAGRGMRAHHFSLDQLSPAEGTSTLVASMLVDAVGGGLSLGELLDEVRGRVAADAELASRVDAVAFQTLGDALAQALEMRFDRELASESLAWFDVTQVPCVTLPLPAGVSEVRFKADLSAAPPLSPSDVRARGVLGAALA